MEKRDSETFEINDRGTTWDATVNYWEIGARDEISVGLFNEYVDQPSQQHKFGVTDGDERECVFRSNNVDGDAKPNRPAIMALTRYGWTCTNFSLDRLKREEHENVLPTLQYMDDAIAGILEMPDSPVAEHGFLLDLLETAETAIALVNTVTHTGASPPPVVEEEGLDPLDILFAESDALPVLEAWLRYEFASDPYNRLYLPELAEEHFGMDLWDADLDDEVDDEVRLMLTQAGVNPDHEPERMRPPDFDGIRWADDR